MSPQQFSSEIEGLVILANNQGASKVQNLLTDKLFELKSVYESGGSFEGKKVTSINTPIDWKDNSNLRSMIYAFRTNKIVPGTNQKANLGGLLAQFEEWIKGHKGNQFINT